MVQLVLSGKWAIIFGSSDFGVCRFLHSPLDITNAFNSFMPNVITHPYQLDEPMSDYSQTKMYFTKQMRNRKSVELFCSCVLLFAFSRC